MYTELVDRNCTKIHSMYMYIQFANKVRESSCNCIFSTMPTIHAKWSKLIFKRPFFFVHLHTLGRIEIKNIVFATLEKVL